MGVKKRARVFTVCLFAGTSSGNNPEFTAAAERFGRALGEYGYELMFGGGTTGIMGAVAHEAIRYGVKVTSVIPRTMANRDDTLDRSQGADEVISSGNMHQRKEYMYRVADAFVVFPGGIGTTDELIEVLTWKNLGLHDKPIILANIEGYWGFVLSALQSMEGGGFLSKDTMDKIQLVDDVDLIIDMLRQHAQHKNSPKPDLDNNLEYLNSLSSLNLASAIQSEAASEGFDWENHGQAYEKVRSELQELEDEISSGQIDGQRVCEELGDVLLALINLVRHLKLDHDEILEAASRKFIARYSRMKQLMQDAVPDRKPSLDQMLKYWSAAKRQLG